MKTFAAILIVALMTAFAPAANAGPRYHHRHHHHHGIRSSIVVPRYYNPYQYNYHRYSSRYHYPRTYRYSSRPYYTSYPRYYVRPHYYHYRTWPSVRYHYRCR